MPRLTNDDPKTLVAFRFHPALLEALRTAAKESADSLTGYVEQVLRERLLLTGYLPKRKGATRKSK